MENRTIYEEYKNDRVSAKSSDLLQALHLAVKRLYCQPQVEEFHWVFRSSLRRGVSHGA